MLILIRLEEYSTGDRWHLVAPQGNWDHARHPRMSPAWWMYHSRLTNPLTLMKSFHLLARGLRSQMPDCWTQTRSWPRSVIPWLALPWLAIPWSMIPLVRRSSNATRHDLCSTEPFAHHS